MINYWRMADRVYPPVFELMEEYLEAYKWYIKSSDPKILKQTLPNFTLFPVILGGCGSISLILSSPGASQVIEGLSGWYSKNAQENLLEKSMKSVCPKTVLEASKICNGGYLTGRGRPIRTLVISGALTTNVPRRGKNEAYILIDQQPEDVNEFLRDGLQLGLHIVFPSLPQDAWSEKSSVYIARIRAWEDFLVALASLSLSFMPLIKDQPVTETLSEIYKTVLLGLCKKLGILWPEEVQWQLQDVREWKDQNS